MSFGYQVLGFGTIGGSPAQDYTYVSGISNGYITQSSAGSQPVTMPSSIQANDLIYVTQYQLIVSSAGYGNHTATAGTGFTYASGAVGFYGYTPYAFLNQTSYYKVAAGNESGQSIGGFATAANIVGTPNYRQTFVDVFRPVIGVSTITGTSTQGSVSGTFSSSGSISRTVTSPSEGVGLGLVMQASYQSNAINITASGHSILKSTDFSLPTGYYSYCKHRFFTVPPSTSVTIASNTTNGPQGLGMNIKAYNP